MAMRLEHSLNGKWVLVAGERAGMSGLLVIEGRGGGLQPLDATRKAVSVTSWPRASAGSSFRKARSEKRSGWPRSTPRVPRPPSRTARRPLPSSGRYPAGRPSGQLDPPVRPSPAPWLHPCRDRRAAHSWLVGPWPGNVRPSPAWGGHGGTTADRASGLPRPSQASASMASALP